jgi:hypothetical protein
MKTFTRFILEAGEQAGKMELVSTSVDKAYEFAKKKFEEKGKSVDKEIPNFKKNYIFAQKQAGTGKTLRKDMPVIDEKDIKDIQRRLKKGFIDITKPFSDETNPSNPFPDGLSGRDAQQWLSNGIKFKDGKKSDDVVKASIGKETVGKLKPIQKQIYADKSIGITATVGVEKTKDFLQNKSTFVISKDNHIIDGHHRYLSGLLVDPKMKVKVLRIDLPVKKLLPLSLSYSDAVGNKRNA